MRSWRINKKEIGGLPRKDEVILRAREARMDIVVRMDKIGIKGAREFILDDTEYDYSEITENEK